MCFKNEWNGCATKLPYLSDHTFAVSGNFLTLILGCIFSSVLVHVVWRVLVACHPVMRARNKMGDYVLCLQASATHLYFWTNLIRAWATLWGHFDAISRAVPEIPESRFIIWTSKRRFVPVWASLNRGFRGLPQGVIVPKTRQRFRPLNNVAQAIRTFRQIRRYLEPQFVVQTDPEIPDLKMCMWASRRQLTPNFGRIFGPRDWATLSSFWCNLPGGIDPKTGQRFRPRNV